MPTYCSTLSLLSAVIRKKRRRILDVDNVIILHDNVRPHVANKTVNKLRKFHWEFLEHPPYNPDLAPSDFHLFSPLKKILAGQRFTCDDEVKAVVRQWFHSQLANFYCSGITKLVLRWVKCLNRHGDYVEKLWNVQGIISTCLVRCMYLILPGIKYGQRLFDLPSYYLLVSWAENVYTACIHIPVEFHGKYSTEASTNINKRYGHAAHTFSRLLSNILIWERFISISSRFQMTDNNTFLAVSPADLMT